MWEHKHVKVALFGEGYRKIQDVLDENSKEGWELVSVVAGDYGNGCPSSSREMHLFFKRPFKG